MIYALVGCIQQETSLFGPVPSWDLTGLRELAALHSNKLRCRLV